jgi:hypothetical protein
MRHHVVRSCAGASRKFGEAQPDCPLLRFLIHRPVTIEHLSSHGHPLSASYKCIFLQQRSNCVVRAVSIIYIVREDARNPGGCPEDAGPAADIVTVIVNEKKDERLMKLKLCVPYGRSSVLSNPAAVLESDSELRRDLVGGGLRATFQRRPAARCTIDLHAANYDQTHRIRGGYGHCGGYD